MESKSKYQTLISNLNAERNKLSKHINDLSITSRSIKSETAKYEYIKEEYIKTKSNSVCDNCKQQLL